MSDQPSDTIVAINKGSVMLKRGEEVSAPPAFLGLISTGQRWNDVWFHWDMCHGNASAFAKKLTELYPEQYPEL